MKKKSLKANFVFALTGNILYTISQYAILTLLTKSFSSDEVGIYLFALAFVTPIVIPFDMQLRSFYITERKEGLGFHDYHGFRLLSNTLALVMIVLAALLLKPAMFATILLVGISKIIESQADMYYGSVQKAERMDYISYSKFAKGLSSLLLVFICIRMGMSINEILMVWCTVWLVILLAFDVPITLRLSGVGKKSGVRFNKKTLLAIFKLCIPVLILSFVDKFASSYPNYVIEHNLGLSAVAIFGTIVYFRAVGAQVINPMSAVIAPRLADYLVSKKYDNFRSLIRRSTATAFALGAAGIIIAALFGEWILTTLYTAEYAGYYQLLVMVMVYCLITYMYIFLGTAITCMRVHWIKLPIHVLSFIVLATLLYFQRSSLSLYNVMGSMMIAEGLVFLLYNISFVILFNRIKNGQNTNSRFMRMITSKGVS